MKHTGFRDVGARLSNWGRWGSDDELGTLNFLTPERRAAAAKLIEHGTTIPLGLDLNDKGPQPSGGIRENCVHVMTRTGESPPAPGGFLYLDDLVTLHTHAATQVDALSHVAYDGYLYNGTSLTTVTEKGAGSLGIENLRGSIQGRGVLLDLPEFFGVSHLEAGRVITVQELDACLAAQGVSTRAGDVLLIRTGWMKVFLLDGDRQRYLGAAPGIGLDVAQWLHEKKIAFIASDNYAVEAVPGENEGEEMPVHCVLVRDMGMPLGEMFNLEGLSQEAKRRARWEFFFTCQVLPITGGVGSPVAPVATF
ncbi:MAG: cyclase family protein [Microbacteriaceae bacterium]|jgi:kynurenine formamidase|nr:cyclase family protein [Microbacteriaceae bacterium]